VVTKQEAQVKVVARAVERNCKLNTLCLAWSGIGDLDPTSEEAGSKVQTHPLSLLPLPISPSAYLSLPRKRD